MAILTPAYGRRYSSQTSLIKDWLEGKDFIFNDISSPYDGKYCSIRDFKPGERLQFRFGRTLGLSFVLTVPE